MKGLKALAKVVRKYFIHNMDKEITAIEKELKALEIIKNKRVDVGFFMILQYGENPLEELNRSYEETQRLTQEEYDLLKEVLL